MFAAASHEDGLLLSHPGVIIFFINLYKNIVLI